ncbi:MAG: hypothetical protein RLZZ22_1234 [Pseudomonadota bacterium]|jgi:N-acetylglucosaminyldiphosphoundecaprenol N-acetyl-beta-D-mannosaminyltransferase
MARQAMPAVISIRDIRLTNLTLEEALDAIHAAVRQRVTTRVAFVNADCVNIAARDAGYLADLRAMDWVFADGIGMKLAGQWLRQPVRANVNGTDLFPRLCEDMARAGQRLFLLGATPGVAQAAGEWAQARHPGLVLAGTQHGYGSADELPALLERIRLARPDVLLVGLGAPRQERWIQAHAASTGASVVMGVGGLYDYYSGRIPRAPLWMRRCGLEWLFRLLQEPRRLAGRYLIGNWIFMLRVLGDRWRDNRGNKP